VVANNVTLDVFLGGPGGYHELRERGELTALKPNLLLPAVYEPASWKNGALKWDDPEGTFMLQTVEWVHCWPAFNSNAIKPETITSWKQLLEPQYKGKIAAIDPRTAGAGLAVAAYLKMTFDIEFVKKLYVDQAVTYTRDGRQLVEWAVRGSYPIVLGAVPTNVELFVRQGVKSVYVRQLDDGPGSVLGGFSVVKVPKRAPHPNAAIVFLNWYASQQGQQIYATQMLEPSLRVDVPTTGMPQYAIPVAGAKYLDQYEPEFYLNARTQVEADVKTALGGR
jgi:ABC-type Fe3+ transport system substrate-binding protein